MTLTKTINQLILDIEYTAVKNATDKKSALQAAKDLIVNAGYDFCVIDVKSFTTLVTQLFNAFNADNFNNRVKASDKLSYLLHTSFIDYNKSVNNYNEIQDYRISVQLRFDNTEAWTNNRLNNFSVKLNGFNTFKNYIIAHYPDFVTAEEWINIENWHFAAYARCHDDIYAKGNTHYFYI